MEEDLQNENQLEIEQPVIQPVKQPIQTFTERHNAQHRTWTKHYRARDAQDSIRNIPTRVINRREIDAQYNPQHCNRWDTDTLGLLNQNKVRFSPRMLNPVNARSYAVQHNYEYIYDQDIDEDGKVDIQL